jgi:hypothetical protein
MTYKIVIKAREVYLGIERSHAEVERKKSNIF